jgi:hypothetical protein
MDNESKNLETFYRPSTVSLLPHRTLSMTYQGYRTLYAQTVQADGTDLHVLLALLNPRIRGFSYA